MVKETFRGKPVLFCDDDLISFYSDLFNMIDDNAGPSSILKSDEDINYHFQSIRKRLNDMVCPVGCSEWFVIGLGDSPSDGE